MFAGVISLVLTGLGALLVIVGVIVSLADRKRRLAAEDRMIKEPTGGGDFEWIVKLTEALGDKPLGFQLMIIGMTLMLVGGVTGGVSSLS